MSRSNPYNKKDRDLLDLSSELFERTEIPFDRSKEEVWKELSRKLHATSHSGISSRQVFFTSRRIALAASLALLLSVGFFSRFYRVQTDCPAGENMTVTLPGGSVAELNGGTTLHVHPLWWPLSRKVYQEGEAFYTVKQGNTFAVRTPGGTAEVLGTTFTVFDREERFNVTCHTGRVRVKATSDARPVDLSRNERAELTRDGSFEVRKVKVDPYEPAWNSPRLTFTSAPFRQVMEEVERYYGIRVSMPAQLDLRYTGNFKLNPSVEKTLSLLCRPFNLNYEKRSESEYQITRSTGD